MEGPVAAGAGGCSTDDVLQGRTRSGTGGLILAVKRERKDGKTEEEEEEEKERRKRETTVIMIISSTERHPAAAHDLVSRRAD